MNCKILNGLICLFLISGCTQTTTSSQSKSDSNWSSSFTPTLPDLPLDFMSISFEPIQNQYTQAGVCPEEEIFVSVPDDEDTTFSLAYHGMNRSRNTNEIIIYNQGTSSNCNGWGYEVAVNSDGYVVDMKSLTPIPSGGFVISGHGEANIATLTSRFKIGQKVTYDDHLIHVTSNYYVQKQFEMNQTLQNYNEQYSQSQEQLLAIDYTAKEDIDTLCDCSLKANQAYEQYQQTGLQSDLRSFNHYAGYFDIIAPTTQNKLFPSRVVESRGVWHRPNERSVAQIHTFLDLMEQANINTIYLELDLDDGLAYIDNKYPLHSVVNHSYTGYEDYMSAFIDLAHQRGMEVHAWDKVFKVIPAIYNDHPDWQMYYYNNGNYAKNMDQFGLLFFDPAIEEVKQFVVDKIDYILGKYDFDGYQFDYIRYPNGNSDIATSSGYSQEAIQKFGQTPTSSNYAQWSTFRQNQVNETVQRATTLIRQKYPYIKTSVAVVSDINDARQNKLQNWVNWIENGYIDIIELMAYYYDSSIVKQDTIALKNLSKTMTFNYTGISPTYNSLPLKENAYQVEAANEGGAHGTMYFAGHNIVNNPSVATLLKQSVYRLPNILPHDDVNIVMMGQFSEILYKYETIYIPFGAASANQKEQLQEKLYEIMNQRSYTVEQMKETQEQIQELGRQRENYGNEVVQQRLREDLMYLNEIISIHITQKQQKEK